MSVLQIIMRACACVFFRAFYLSEIRVNHVRRYLNENRFTYDTRTKLLL